MIDDEYDEDGEQEDEDQNSDDSQSEQMQQQAERENELKEQAAQDRAIKKEIKKKNPNSVKNRTKKEIGNAIKKGLKEFITKNPKLILVIAIIIAVLIIFAIILYIFSTNKDGDIVAAPDDFVSVLPANSQLRIEYETTNSLINYRLNKEPLEVLDETNTATIESIYDMFINKKDPKEYADLLKDMKNKYKEGTDNIIEKKKGELFDSKECIEGTVICIDTSRGAVSPNEDKELYKHILMTDKYNFNAIRWHSYSGNHSKGVIVDEKYLDSSNGAQISVNKKTGIQYPNDSKMSETDFTRGFLRYLQNWSIPLAMYDGSIKSGEEGITQNANFAYQIIANAMSDVEVNKYKVDNREQVLEKILLTSADVSKDFCDPITGDCHTVYRTISLSTERGPTELEDIVTPIYQYRLSDARTFDVNIHNSYSYVPYNENDEPMDTFTDKFDYSEPYNDGEWSGTAYGKRYEIHNFWWDKLDLINTDSKYLTKSFVKSYSGGTYSDNEEKYYADYEKKEQIDRVMLINSKKDIYTKYMLEEDSFDDHIGYTRYALDNSYLQLRKKLSAVAGQYVYGHSLGIDTSKSADTIIDIGGSIPVIIPEGGLGWPAPSKKITALNGNTQEYFQATGRPYHEGIDIAHIKNNVIRNNGADLLGGDTIVATHSGTVIAVKTNETRQANSSAGYGNYVKIKMDSGQYTTLYAHLSYVAVKTGDHVNANDPIGLMGMTGNAGAVHLHYEVRDVAGRLLDPLRFYNTEPEYNPNVDHYYDTNNYSYVSSKEGATNQ